MHFIREVLEETKRVVNYTSWYLSLLLSNVKGMKSRLLLKDLCVAAPVWNLPVHFVLNPLQFEIHQLLLWQTMVLVVILTMKC
jgi:hypothetical protein